MDRPDSHTVRLCYQESRSGQAVTVGGALSLGHLVSLAVPGSATVWLVTGIRLESRQTVIRKINGLALFIN